MKKMLMAFLMVMLVSYTWAQSTPKGLNINDAAPAFSGVDQSGAKINLQDLLKKGPVVLVFYRGEWCPYCNKQLKALEDSLSFIKEKGAQLVAVSPEIPENISKTVSKTKATYPVISDKDLAILNAYDVAYAVDDNTISKYKGYGIDFNKVNGSNGANLPVPTVYIINKSGIVVYKSFNPDYTKRPSVKEILEHL